MTDLEFRNLMIEKFAKRGMVITPSNDPDFKFEIRPIETTEKADK